METYRLVQAERAEMQVRFLYISGASGLVQRAEPVQKEGRLPGGCSDL